MHTGALNNTIPEQHDCLGKNCTFLEKNCQSPFWRVLEEAKLTKEKRKEKIRLEKQKKAQAESDMRILANSWNAYLEELQYEMQIICVPEDTPSSYRIFYVSANRFAGGNRYPEFLEMLKQTFPRSRFFLRHIRDADGHFVTRDEYSLRRRK